MEAYYYSIIDNSTKTIVLEGIIRNSEDTIYPGQHLDDPTLPGECECHNFKHPNYSRIGYYFDIPIKFIEAYRLK